jgi:TolA-binding protein
VIVFVALWYVYRRVHCGPIRRDLLFAGDLDTLLASDGNWRRRVAELEGRDGGPNAPPLPMADERIAFLRRAAASQRKGKRAPSPLVKWIASAVAVICLSVASLALRPAAIAEVAASYEAAKVASLLEDGDEQAVIQMAEVGAIEETGALYNAAMAFLKDGRLDKAKEHFESVVRANPYYANAHYNIGQIDLQRKEYATAERSFRKCLEIDGGMADAHFALATSLLKLRRIPGTVTN